MFIGRKKEQIDIFFVLEDLGIISKKSFCFCQILLKIAIEKKKKTVYIFRGRLEVHSQIFIL